MNMSTIMQTTVRVLAVILVTAGCTTSPTGTTKDSFDMTSSTSGHAWYTDDGILKDDHRVVAFTTVNFTVLKQDMARGEGEYLASLATLLGLPASRHSEFRALVQHRYATLISSGQTTAGEMLTSLAGILDASPKF